MLFNLKKIVVEINCFVFVKVLYVLDVYLVNFFCDIFEINSDFGFIMVTVAVMANKLIFIFVIASKVDTVIKFNYFWQIMFNSKFILFFS